MSERVLLGFSGGVDSQSAAIYLQNQGYQVVALTLDMIGDAAILSKASRAAHGLGVEHHVVDVRLAFSQHIIDYFVNSYLSGYTPAPCTMCNPLIKWEYMVRVADDMGISKIASGHYFNIETLDGYYYVAKAEDISKDQSYYLWGLSQATLSRIITPMGRVYKQHIKSCFADKRESMGVCFLGNKSYRDFILSHNPSVLTEGDVVDTLGNIVGSHEGIAFYTIGQKRGYTSSIAGSVVVDIDASRNQLVVSTDMDLYKSNLEIVNCNIVNRDELFTLSDISVVVRGLGRNPGGFVRQITPTREGLLLSLSDPAWALAIGQPVVLYRGNKVLGGGYLKSRY